MKEVEIYFEVLAKLYTKKANLNPEIFCINNL